METPVLATKLFVPAPRPRAVPRVRLLEQLDLGLDPHCRLTLVSAPAGFGKTTMLGEWVAHRVHPRRHRGPETGVAWLSLDDGDSDAVRFLTYVVVALQGVHADVGAEALSLLHTGLEPSLEPALTALVNDLARTVGETVLVLDDYHVIDAHAVHDALAFLVEHLPPRLHLVVATRSDPPLPLARLRSRGGLTEVRASDLRFTSDEAGTFLNEVMDLSLSTDDVASLEVRTEGWIAGLQMAAVSMRGRDDVSGFIDAFAGSNRFVLDYLAEEVLQRQPDHVRRFLLRTAVLDRMTGPLCDAVTGEEGGNDVLASLERANLFVVPLDDRREWYRYHHLFAEVLRSRLRQEQPEEVLLLHRSASEWFERYGLLEESVSQALAADDVERAATLVESALPAIRRERQDATLLGWLDRIPDDVARRRPVLSAFHGWRAMVAGDLDAVEPWLQAAERAMATTAHPPAGGEELRRLPMTIAVYRAAVAQAQGDLAASAEHARHVFDLAGPEDHLARSGAAGYLGLASYARGDLDSAVRIFAETPASLRTAGNTADELSSTVVLADMWIARGQLVEARRLYEQALRTVADMGTQVTAATGDVHVGFSELLRELGDLAAARHHLQVSSDLGERASLIENRYRWFLATALVRQAEGDPASAVALLDEAQRRYRRGFLPELRPVAAVRARVQIAGGDLSSATHWARERGLAATDQLSYLHEFEHLTLVRLLLAQHRSGRDPEGIDDALSLLDRLRAAVRPGRRLHEILVLRALAYEAQHDRTQALATLEQALAATESEGHVRLFLDEGPPMDALLRAANLSRVAPSRETRLRAAAPDAASSPQHALVDPLSDREVEVLRLLNTTMSVPEIAGELFVSPNTLRTHTKHIFAKLAVNNRRAAVHRAAELGLL